MSGFIFAYTIVILLVFAAASIFSLASFFVSGRKATLARVALFAIYSLGLIGIFGSEWAVETLSAVHSGYYEIPNAFSRIALSSGVLLCCWLVVCQILDIHDRRLQIAPVVVYAVLDLVVLLAMPAGPWRQWVYYSLRQCFFAFTQIYAYRAWKTSKDETFRARVGKHAGQWKIMWLLIAAILIEDTLIILVLPAPADEQLLLLFFSSRSISENVMMLYLAYCAIKDAVVQLSLRSEQAPVAKEGGADITRHIDELLPAYASARKLSNREREVLAMVLEGKDNRTIAGELFLSEGTVKTHVHNIMKKTGTSSREELKKDFWSN